MSPNSPSPAPNYSPAPHFQVLLAELRSFLLVTTYRAGVPFSRTRVDSAPMASEEGTSATALHPRKERGALLNNGTVSFVLDVESAAGVATTKRVARFPLFRMLRGRVQERQLQHECLGCGGRATCWRAENGKSGRRLPDAIAARVGVAARGQPPTHFAITL
jgi:hypothetical protein